MKKSFDRGKYDASPFFLNWLVLVIPLLFASLGIFEKATKSKFLFSFIHSKFSRWRLKGKVIGSVRKVIWVANRRFGGYDNRVNVSGEIIKPTEIENRVKIDEKTGHYVIVQVSDEPQTLVLKSTLKALRNQYAGIKELLPLEAVTAFEFLVAYFSFLELNPESARRVREEFEQYSTGKEEVKSWYEKFEYLYVRGYLRGVILPTLEEIFASNNIITEETRKDCVDYIKWIHTSGKTIDTPDARKVVLPFFSKTTGLKLNIIPVGDLDWSEYLGAALYSIGPHECDMVIFGALGFYNGEKAVQAASALKFMTDANLSDFSIFRIVITSLGGQDTLATYISVNKTGGKEELKRTDEARQKFVDTNKCIVIRNGKFTSIALKQLEKEGETVIMNADSLSFFLSASFNLIRKTGAKIVMHAIWRNESQETMLLFHLKR